MANIKEVAQFAKVSPSTVSRVLSGNAPVKKQTKDLVLKAVEQLDYHPSVVAKALKEGSTRNIALMIPNIENQIFPVIVRGVEDTARKNGFTVILCNTDRDIAVEENYIKKLKQNWTDGFIFATVTGDNQHIFKLKEANIPVVLVARAIGEEIDAVVVDNFKIGHEATQYLIKTGHRKIGIAVGEPEVNVYQIRYDGYCKALEEHGIPVNQDYVMHETNSSTSFYALTQRMLQKGKVPDAFFCTSDEKALVVIRAIKDFGLRVPEDISVIGVDNLKICSFMDPMLTTISQPLYEMGMMAAQKIINMIKNPAITEPIVDILPIDLIIRDSTR